MNDFNTAEDWVQLYERRGTDISEHLRTLGRLAEGCGHVTELGVRWVCSSFGLMLGRPNVLLSIDVNPVNPEMLAELTRIAAGQGTEFRFVQDNVLTTNEINETDLLFIDTVHSYKQLKTELYLHSSKVKKYIIMHDTVSFGNQDEGQVDLSVLPRETAEMIDALPRRQGLLAAIDEFLAVHTEWSVQEHHTNNNGLMVLTRK